MSSDFVSRGRAAREELSVPPVPLEWIRSRAHVARTRDRLRAVVACAVLVVAALGTGTGIAKTVYDGVRLRLGLGGAALTVRSIVDTRNPTAADLRAAIANATFPIVLPVGLPAGSRVIRVLASADGHPSAVFVSYVDRGGRDSGSFGLLDPNVVESDASAANASASLGDVLRRRVGGETLIVGKRYVSPADFARITSAMERSTPAASLRATDAMLTRLVVLGGQVRLAAAERALPANASGVLLSEDQIRSIALLAASGRSILDDRTHHIGNVPYANGHIEYAKIMATAPHVVAVPASGVRAVAAVLRSRSRARSACRCEVLVSRGEANTWRIWTIAMFGPPTVHAYTVDARTLRSTQSASRRPSAMSS